MYSYYSDEIIEEVRINNDIVDVVSEYVKLEKKGKYLFGCCPFHKEKTPSFSVTPAKQIFYCYGCGKGGNVIHFVMNAENLDYIETIRHLAERARIQLPEGESREDRERARIKQEIVKLNTEAARFFFSELNTGQNEKARKYLEGRKISERVIKRFGIGYSPEGWNSLHKYLLSKGFDDSIILKSGLILPNKNGGYYDRFRGRIMFPIFDIRGNVIGFGGRVIDDSLPKYINSPETPVYSKGRNLYALNQAKNSGEKRIIIVEGYMDVISLHQCGIINTVASLGTALTESQGRLLKKYSEEIIISYDADAAGQAATMKGLDLLNDIGCNVKVLMIPDGKDPDEYVRNNGVEKLKSIIDESISLIEYKIKVLKKQIITDTTEGKINFLNRMAEILSKVDNQVEREMYIKKLSREYEISEEAILSEVVRKIRPRSSLRPAAANMSAGSQRTVLKAKAEADNKMIHSERLLLALLCVDNSLYKVVKESFKIEDFSDEGNRKAAAITYERLDSKKGIVTAELLGIVGQDSVGEFTKIIQEECNCEDKVKAVLDIIKRMQQYKLDKRQKEILDLLNKAELPEGDVVKLKQELNSIIMGRKQV